MKVKKLLDKFERKPRNTQITVVVFVFLFSIMSGALIAAIFRFSGYYQMVQYEKELEKSQHNSLNLLIDGYNAAVTQGE